MPDDLKKFWQNDLIEIRKNKFRFAALVILLILVIILALSDSDSSEEITLNEQPQFETANEIAPVPESNITIAFGANSGNLYISNPFKVEPKFEPVDLTDSEVFQLTDIPKVPPPRCAEITKKYRKFYSARHSNYWRK